MPTKFDVEDTKQKICEAQHFFNEIDETQNDPKLFRHNLSAFLSAFRSIRHFMREEFKNQKLDPCHKQLRKWMENDPRVRLLTGERNVNTHERMISTRNDVAVGVPSVGATAQAGQVSVRIVNENGSVTESPSHKEAEPAVTAEETGGKEEPWVKYTWYFTLDGHTKEDQKIRTIPGIDAIIKTDVVTICEECLKDLKDRVSACDLSPLAKHKLKKNSQPSQLHLKPFCRALLHYRFWIPVLSK